MVNTTFQLAILLLTVVQLSSVCQAQTNLLQNSDPKAGQRLRSESAICGEWVQMSGIFKVPDGTSTIRFFLSQAERAGDPHNGSAARFDDVGLYLFATREEAEAFVAAHQYR